MRALRKTLSILVALIATTSIAAAARRELPLSSGLLLDPEGESFPVGNFPLAVAIAPGDKRLVVLLSGWLEQGLQVVDRASGAVLQTLPQRGAFLGLTFDAKGKTLYTSGGTDDVIYRYTWNGAAAEPAGTIALAVKESPSAAPTRYPAGLALSPDGLRLYVAENMADQLAVINLRSGKVEQRLATGHYPYAVAVAVSGRVFVSQWGDRSISAFDPRSDGSLRPKWSLEVGRHPSAMALNRRGTRLFVASASTDRIAVVDAKRGTVLATLADAPPVGPAEGSTPNALAISPDGARLYVAEADADAVAVFDLSSRTADSVGAKGSDRLSGRIPTGWYPSGVLALADAIWVLNAKGLGSSANPGMAQPGKPLDDKDVNYSLGQIRGTLERVASDHLTALDELTHRVAVTNGWDHVPGAKAAPTFEHVVYIIKENRTYDQVLGDLPQGDGEPSLTFFPRDVAPNHHALAERFGIYDRFFTNAEVSSQGHIWSTAAYVTDYTEKVVPSLYSNRRPAIEEGDVDEPARGFLWDAAVRKGVSLRVYGEFAQEAKNPAGGAPTYESTKRNLAPYTSTTYPAFDMTIPDQRRADVWIRDLRNAEKDANWPALQILHLPSDHTAGARPGQPTPRACMADNDLALGRIIEALSTSVFWKNTVVFVLEDDAQAGPDHVDSHRSVLLVISAHGRPGTVHRFVNTTDVLATLEGLLGLEALSKFDYLGQPLFEQFVPEPDLAPYKALTPSVPLTEVNPTVGPAAQASARLDLRRPDASDDALFNRILWVAIKGTVPYPGARRLNTLDILREESGIRK